MTKKVVLKTVVIIIVVIITLAHNILFKFSPTPVKNNESLRKIKGSFLPPKIIKTKPKMC